MKPIAIFLICISLTNGSDLSEDYHRTPSKFFSTTIGDTADFLTSITSSAVKLLSWPVQSTLDVFHSFFPDYDGGVE